jgi:hypothetical protein
MDFLDQLFEKHGPRHPRQHDEHGQHSPRPPWDASHGDLRYARAAEHDHGAHPGHDAGLQGRLGLQGMLGVLAQHKALLVIGAVLLLVVGIGGILAVVLVLSLLGTLGPLVGVQDLTALLGDLPRLVNTLLVDAPKAILDYLAPLFQLKGTLEGKA